MLTALLLSELLYPAGDARRSALDRLARRIAFNRVVAGVHFPIDSAAGSALAHQLAATLVADPQVLARGMVAEVEHAKAGRQKTLGVPLKFSATPARVRRAAPKLGQHDEEVRAALGGKRPRKAAARNA